jgi:hypothetical protein
MLAEQGNMPTILAIEAILKEMPQADHEVQHLQIHGVYVRILRLKAGTMLTGKIHKSTHISILAQGTLKYATSDGADIITAVTAMVDQPGIKRLGYAMTDVVFINVMRTDLVSIEDIERKMVCDTFEEYEQYKLLTKESTCHLQQL